MNIIWEQPSGSIAVTSIFDGTDPEKLAVLLKDRGDVPADWNSVAFNFNGLFPAAPQEFWRWAQGQIVLAIDMLKAHVWAAIKAERDRRKAGGVKVGAKWFHSDDGSRIQQMGLVMMGASIPANPQWKTMDGSFITMTQTLASQVFQAVAASDQAIFTAAETHRVAMEASADPASYDYSGGWPKIYGE